MLRIMWPEGEPEKAVLVNNAFRDFLNAFSWSMRGHRTCRLKGNVGPTDNPVVSARQCERIIRKYG